MPPQDSVRPYVETTRTPRSAARRPRCVIQRRAPDQQDAEPREVGPRLEQAMQHRGHSATCAPGGTRAGRVRVQTDPVEHGHRRAEHDVPHQDEHPADVRGREASTPTAPTARARRRRRGTERGERRAPRPTATADRESSTSFGRPAVPEVATTSPTRSGSGGAGSAKSVSSSAVTTEAGRARSTIARRSREVRRASSGRTAAPAAHSSVITSNQAGPGGRSTATRNPGAAPRYRLTSGRLAETFERTL